MAKTKPQFDKFKGFARELGTNGSEEAFDRALKKVAKAPVEKPAEKPAK